MLRRIITLRNPKKLLFSFELTRHGVQYLGRYVKYRGQKIIVVWRRDNMKDADFIVLKGEMKKWKEAIEEKFVDPDACCCDTMCTGCSHCVGATCFCLACVDKKPGEKSLCLCAKTKCVQRVANVYYNEEEQEALMEFALKEEQKGKELKR